MEMALMYPWATKEYLLWEMTIGQIIFYHNKGIDIKYNNDVGSSSSVAGLADKDVADLRKLRDETKAFFEQEKQDALKQEMRNKYGAVDDG